MAEPVKLLILEEAVLLTMAADSNFVREFPFLAGLKPAAAVRSGCGRCARNAANRVNSVNAIKSSLISMGAEKKQRLKKMLRAEKVRLRVANGGRVTEYTF